MAGVRFGKGGLLCKVGKGGLLCVSFGKGGLLCIVWQNSLVMEGWERWLDM